MVLARPDLQTPRGMACPPCLFRYAPELGGVPGGVDFLLTCNCKHLANANKAPHIRVANTRLGLAVPLLVTPLQLLGEDLP